MKKTLVQKMLSLFLGGIFVFVFVATAGAMTWTDNGTYAPSNGGTNPITYTLSFGDPSSSGGFKTYGATFTIETAADTYPEPEWYAGWFLFKFDMGEKGIISNLTDSDPINSWTIVNATDPLTDPNVNVLKAGGNYRELVHNAFTGFCATSLMEDGIDDDVTDGVWLTGGASLFTFTFDFTLPDYVDVKDEVMPFQVGLYDGLAGKSGNTIVNLLSEELSIPDPAAVFLLGPACLIGFAGLRRKFKM